MNTLKKRQKTYSKMYYVTGIFHLMLCIVMAVEKCFLLSVVNMALFVFYMILGLYVKKAHNFSKPFFACGAAISLFVLSHFIILGPDYGFQYLLLGSIPAIYFMAYTGECELKMSIISACGAFLSVIVASFISFFVDYPLNKWSGNCGTTLARILLIINVMISFWFACVFMTSLVKQAANDNGRLKNMNSNLELFASVDALTGLKNRRSIDSYMEKSLARAKGEGVDFSVFMCDVDNFKKVNDTYGHDCGDEVLKNIAKILEHEIRPEDGVFRFGGEEILLIIGAAGHIAKKVAERCRAAIEDSEVVYEGTSIKVTITIGGASYFQGATQDELIKRADDNLYIGKNNGKNQVVM